MAGDEPGNDEDAKSNVANGGVAHVLEQFCSLSKLAELISVSSPTRRMLTGNMISTKSMMHMMHSPTRIW